MNSFKMGRSSGIQKEHHFIRDNSALVFISLRDVPFEISPRFKERITGENKRVGQIVSIRPLGENLTWNLITREIGKRRLSLINYDRINDRNLESDRITLQNIQNMKEEVALGKSKMIKFSSTYFLKGSVNEIIQLRKEILRQLKNNGLKIENKRFSDVKVRDKTLSGEIEGIYVNPESASYLVPVNKGYLFHENGTFYGECEISKAPVFLDRSRYPSSHELVLGMTGFGKSFFVKATMMREKLTKKIFVKIIDPLGEYGGLASSINARSIDLLNQEMNMFERIEFLTVKENVDRVIALLITLFDLQNEDRGIIDTALTSMYENHETIEFLKRFIKSQSLETYNRISPVFEGSLKMFSTGSNPPFTGDLRINLNNVPKKLLSFYMLLSLDLLMRSGGTDPTNIVIDEAHYLLDENAVTSVERYVRHARHSNISLILISQSSNDFLKSRSSISIMENCSIHVLFRHQVISEEMARFYSLDEGLSNFLKIEAGYNGKYSLGLFYSPGFRTILKVQSSEQEMKKINGVPEG